MRCLIVLSCLWIGVSGALNPVNGEEPTAKGSEEQVTREEFEQLAARLRSTEAALAAMQRLPAADDWAVLAPQASESFVSTDAMMASGGDKSAEAGASPIKYPTIQVNGVFQADVGFFSQSAANVATYGRIQDGADFRRARLSAKGSVSETTNYFFQMDFGFFGRPTFTDVWLETTDLPVLGNVRIGQWKQPFSLEVVSSFRYTTFMERSLLFQAFTPFRHLGIGFYDHSEDLRYTWAASMFRTGQDQFGGSISTNGGWGTAERVTWLPWWDEPSNGEGYLHLGLGHFYNSPPRDLVNFRTIPEIYIGENAPGAPGTSGQPEPGLFNGTPFFAATGPKVVSQYNVFGGELLWVRGPWSLQSEAMLSYVQQRNGTEATLPGAYGQIGYFLTGEHRPYDRKAGAIDRVIPHENFFRVRTTDDCVATGMGAWEVAARISWIDLTDQDIVGGEVVDGTLGVNWYWNPFTKIVFNYIHSVPTHPNQERGTMDAFAMRAQIDF
jgi:phosphate-selective porin OprO/OprP